MLSRCFLDFSVGVGAFVIALSKIAPLFFQYLMAGLTDDSTNGNFCLLVVKCIGIFGTQTIP